MNNSGYNPYYVDSGSRIHGSTIVGPGDGTSATINMSHQLSTIESRLKEIESRLVILIPDPVLLEKHQALKEAYDHYKLMEKLLTENP